MAEILLTHSYFLRFDPKQWKAQRPYAPLATLYAASVLRSTGMDIQFYDTTFDSSVSNVVNAIFEHGPKYFIICDDGFNYLTKMCLLNMREAAFEMIAAAKKQEAVIIVSSSDASDHSEEYLRAGADYVVVGEMEITLEELMVHLQDGKTDPNEVNGLRFLRDGRLIQTNPRGNLRDLDQLPKPAWDLIDIAAYKNRWIQRNGYFSLNLVTTRGCPFKCNWCAKPIYGNRYNSRSPENVVEELLWLRSEFGLDRIWFCDDIFGLKPQWVHRFSELVQKNNLKIKYKIQSRADLLLEENTIHELAISGCDEVWIGAESGSQKILDAMDKGIRIEQIHEATELLRKNGIKPCFFLQFGYPGETAADIRATLNMLYTLMPHDIGISVSYPLPGTGFYEKVKAQMQGKTNWKDSDELITLFNGTFPSGFYKKLQRFVHREFRRRQAWDAWKNQHDLLLGLSLVYRIPQSKFSRQSIKKHVFTSPV